MGILQDMVNAKAQMYRDAITRKHDLYTNVMNDETGKFTDEDKQYAWDTLADLASPSKNHSKFLKSIGPVIMQGLRNKNQGQQPTWMGPGASPGGGPGVSPNVDSTSGDPGANSGYGPQNLVDPSAASTGSMPPVPLGVGMAANQPVTSQAMSMPSQVLSPQASSAPQPAPTPTPAPPPPPSGPMGQQPGNGIRLRTTPERDTFNRGRKELQNQFDVQQGLNKTSAEHGQTLQFAQEERQRKQTWLDAHRQELSPYQVSMMEAEIQGVMPTGPGAAGMMFPTLKTPKVLLKDGSVGTLQENPKIPGMYMDMSNKPFDMRGAVALAPTDKEISDYRSQQAYASRLGLVDGSGNPDPSRLTPQQKIEAIQSSAAPTGQIGQNEQDIRRMHPDWPEDRIRAEAGSMFNEDRELRRKGLSTTINLNSERAGQISDIDSQAESIASAIVNHRQPPDMAGLGRQGTVGKVRRILEDTYHFNLVEAEKDWKAVTAHIRTMNGPQIQRQTQAIETVKNTIPMLRQAYANWRATALPSGFSDYNRLALEVAMRTPGQGGVAARELQRQVTDFSAELGAVYMQGNSNTDHSLELAKQNLAASWNSQQFDLALTNAEQFSNIRLNSIYTSGPIQQGGNAYAQGNGAGTTGTNQGQTPQQTFSSGGWNYTDVTGNFRDRQYLDKRQEGQTWVELDSNGGKHTLKKYQGKVYEMSKGGQ